MDPRELWGWSIRSVAVAWPSAAVMIALRWSVLELAAMVTGVALFSGGFAWVASSGWCHASEARRRWWAALESAVWVKAAWMLVGVLAVPVAYLGSPHLGWMAPLFGAFVLDEVTGALSMWIVSGIAGTVAEGPVSFHESFFVTLLVTLFQGSFIALGLAPIAGVVLAYRSWKRTRDAYRNPF
jgi:hypothetical protein